MSGALPSAIAFSIFSAPSVKLINVKCTLIEGFSFSNAAIKLFSKSPSTPVSEVKLGNVQNSISAATSAFLAFIQPIHKTEDNTNGTNKLLCNKP